MLWSMRRALLPLLAVLAAVVTGAALAAGGEREQHEFNAADQAAARSAVIVRSDLNTPGWTGGAKSPDLTPPKVCANWNPKQSDLVLTGAAETDWKHAGLELDTEAQVLQTAAMVKLDWQRTVTDPHVITCLQTQLEKTLAGNKTVKLVSFRRLAVPHLGTYSRAYLTTLDVLSHGRTIPITIEDVLIGSKRTEITISSTTAKVAQARVAAADIRLAKILVARAKA